MSRTFCWVGAASSAVKVTVTVTVFMQPEVPEQLDVTRVPYGLCGLPGEAARADDQKSAHPRACSRSAATTRSCCASVSV